MENQRNVSTNVADRRSISDASNIFHSGQEMALKTFYFHRACGHLHMSLQKAIAICNALFKIIFLANIFAQMYFSTFQIQSLNIFSSNSAI